MLQEIWQWFRQRSRPQQALGVVIVASLIVLGGWWLSKPNPASTLTPETPPVAQAAKADQVHPASSSSHRELTNRTSGASSPIYVDVQGAVRQPGLYHFTTGKRVADAIEAAGGLTNAADRQQVNLATRLLDQQRLYIARRGEHVPATVTSGGSGNVSGGNATNNASTSGATGAPINLNTADLAEFQKLTGIGMKKAQKIIDYRTAHGDFKSVADLTQVPGFGERTVATLRDQLTTE